MAYTDLFNEAIDDLATTLATRGGTGPWRRRISR